MEHVLPNVQWKMYKVQMIMWLFEKIQGDLLYHNMNMSMCRNLGFDKCRIDQSRFFDMGQKLRASEFGHLLWHPILTYAKRWSTWQEARDLADLASGFGMATCEWHRRTFIMDGFLGSAVETSQFLSAPGPGPCAPPCFLSEIIISNCAVSPR